MIESPGLLFSLLAFILVIGPLVFVHEVGHYLAGQLFGVKAEAFSIGFGRELIGWTDRRGTRWKVGWLPLGGYVRFAGDMNPASQPDAAWLALPAAERNRTFQAKPVWQRAIIVAAGPAVNFLVALIILGGFAMAYGDMRLPAVAGAIQPGTPAATAGLKPGDRITAVAGRPIEQFNDLVRFVRIHPGETVRIEADRGGKPIAVTATIATDLQRDRFGNEYRLGMLGIAGGKPVFERVSLLEAPAVATRQIGEIIDTTLETLGQVISGRRSVKELGGPLKIAKVSGEMMSIGPEAYVWLVGLLSINLGFINLLPVPMLDGGHLLFYAVETVRRRPLEPHVQEWAFRGGLAAILMLMLVVTFNDLGAVGLWKSLSGLVGPG